MQVFIRRINLAGMCERGRGVGSFCDLNLSIFVILLLYCDGFGYLYDIIMHMGSIVYSLYLPILLHQFPKHLILQKIILTLLAPVYLPILQQMLLILCPMSTNLDHIPRIYLINFLQFLQSFSIFLGCSLCIYSICLPSYYLLVFFGFGHLFEI